MSENEEGNVWNSLPSPFDDVFLQHILPFLCLREYFSLCAVSHQYNTLLNPHKPNGKKCLIHLLRKHAEKLSYYAQDDTFLRVVEQLPNFGRLTPEESLEADPLFVAKMKRSALRRRSLIRIEMEQPPSPSLNNDTDSMRHLKLKDVLFRYRSHKLSDMINVARDEYFGCIVPRNLSSAVQYLKTELVIMNHSEVDIYCHRIDTNGEVIVQDGDCIPFVSRPENKEEEGSGPFVSSFQISTDENGVTSCPPHVHRLATYSFHSYSLCFKQGGPPFAIYQPHRAWYRFPRQTGVGFSKVAHMHAVAIFPNGRVDELHCNSCRQPRRIHGSWISCYRFRDRQTLALLNEEGRLEPANRPDNSKKLAKSFYGLHLPPIDQRVWFHSNQNYRAHLLGDPNDPLNYPSIFAETSWHYQVVRSNRSGDNDSSNENAIVSMASTIDGFA